MSKVQERGLMEALGEAEGLARVLRTMSGGRLDLVPVAMGSGLGTMQPLSFEAAKTEARVIASPVSPSAAHAPQVAAPWSQPDADPLGDIRQIERDDRERTSRPFGAAAETFCSTCGCLDEPGVHSQQDCPRYELLPATVTPMVITDDIALNMAANVLEAMRPITSYHKKIIQTLRNLLPEAEGKVQGKPYQEQTGKWGQPDRAPTSQPEGI